MGMRLGESTGTRNGVDGKVNGAHGVADEARARTFQRGVLFGSLGVFTLVAGFASTMPFMQAHRDELGCGAPCIGSMTSASSLLRLVGAMVVGRLSDTLGRRSMLWLGLLGCVLSLGISYSVDSLRGMWLALVPSSLLNHNASVLKALFADYANDAGLADVDRASAMGKLGMAIGASFMVGPLLASALASSYSQALALAAGTSALSALFFAQLPPVSLPDTPPLVAAQRSSAVERVRRFFHLPVLHTGGARVILAIRLFAGLAFNIYQVLWAASLKERFHFGPNDYGLFMAIIGFSYALSQGVVAKQLISRAGDRTVLLALGCVLCLGLGRPLALWTLNVRVVYCAFVVMVMALGVLNTLISSACANLATGDELGGLFGTLDAVENCTGIVGPLIGGQLARLGQAVPLGVVVACYGANFAIIAAFYGRHVGNKGLAHASSAKKSQ